MAGINLTGQANTLDYNIGRGKVYFATIDSTTGVPGAFRFLGNAPEFSVSMESETLEHQSSQTGLKVTDKEVTISQKATLSLTLDEINFDNMALFFSGETAAHANTAATAGITGSSNVTVTDGGRWYDLYQNAGGAPASNASANRIYDCGTISVSGSVAGTDFIADQVMGRIFIIAGGNLDTPGTIDVDIAANAGADTTPDEMRGLTSTTVSGALKFISENPADSDHQTEYEFHQVSLKAEGDFGLISDEYTQMSMTGVAERNTTIDTNSPTVTIRTHSHA